MAQPNQKRKRPHGADWQTFPGRAFGFRLAGADDLGKFWVACGLVGGLGKMGSYSQSPKANPKVWCWLTKNSESLQKKWAPDGDHPKTFSGVHCAKTRNKQGAGKSQPQMAALRLGLGDLTKQGRYQPRIRTTSHSRSHFAKVASRSTAGRSVRATGNKSQWACTCACMHECARLQAGGHARLHVCAAAGNWTVAKPCMICA